MTKLRIDIRNGLVEVEADKELAEKVYADFKGILLERMKKSTSASDEGDLNDAGDTDSTPQRTKTKPRSKSTSGPSCASRIEELKKASFFKSLRDIKAISSALAERAHNYQSNQIGAALTTLTKRGTLRRIKQDGTYQYQNP